MSGKQSGMVWERALPHEQAWVLTALADNAHDDGSRCFPSVALLAWKTGYSERQVQRVLQSLRALGYIEAVEFARGGAQPTEYQLHLEAAPLKAPFVQRGHGRPSRGDILSRPLRRDGKGVTSERKGVTDDGKGVTETAKRGDTPEAKTPPNRITVREPSREPSTARARARDGAGDAVDEDWIATMVTEFGDRLGGERSVRDTIEEALNHKASAKWRSKRIGVRNWLRRDAERYEVNHTAAGRSVAASRSAATDPARYVEPPAATAASWASRTDGETATATLERQLADPDLRPEVRRALTSALARSRKEQS